MYSSPPGRSVGLEIPRRAGPRRWLGGAGQRSFDVETTKAGAGGKGNRDAGKSGMHFKRSSESFEDQFLPRKQTALPGLLQSPSPALPLPKFLELCLRQSSGRCLSHLDAAP